MVVDSLAPRPVPPPSSPADPPAIKTRATAAQLLALLQGVPHRNRVLLVDSGPAGGAGASAAPRGVAAAAASPGVPGWEWGSACCWCGPQACGWGG